MTVQRGDGVIHIDGRPCRLRLTLAALAELDAQLNVSGPEELAHRFRNLTQADARIILAILSLDEACWEDVTMISEAELLTAIPVVVKIFEESFA